MKIIRNTTGLLAACLLFAPVVALCQVTGEQPGIDASTGGLKISATKSTPLPTPFPLDENLFSKSALQFFSPAEMSASDRALVERNASAIERLAGIQGFEIEDVGGESATSWGYEQAVCTALPDHLVLEFSRSRGAGDLAVFSASLPRDGTDKVRIVPVERRGFTLFTPSPSNAMTIEAFNHILNSDKHAVRGDWLGLGLCYAALAGGHVRAAVATKADKQDAFPLYAAAMVSLSWKANPEITFSDVLPGKPVKKWQLTFARDGQLRRVKISSPTSLSPLPTKEDPSHENPVPVKGQIVDLGAGK